MGNSRARRAAVCAALAFALTLAAPGMATAGRSPELGWYPLGGGTSDLSDRWVDPPNNWVVSLVVDDNDPNRLYCSTAHLPGVPGALYRSPDGGSYWSPIESGVPDSLASGQGALEMAGSHVLAGSGVGSPNGIWRGTDQGEEWARLTTWSGGSSEPVRDIAVRPNNPRHIFAVTGQENEDAPHLRFSIDDGATWYARDISVPETETRVALSVAVSTTARIFAGCENVSWVAGPNGGGVYVSDDFGRTWDRTGCIDRNVTDIAVDPSDSDVVYACARKKGSSGRLYKSTDGGDSFSVVNIPGNPSPNTVDVDSLGRVFVGARVTSTEYGGVFQSDDGGATWLVVHSGYGPPPYTAGVIAADLDSAGCLLWVGTTTQIMSLWVPSAEEVYGWDRYSTAVEISRTRFPTADSAQTVVIVTGLKFPDAVVAGPYAAARDGAILLAGRRNLTPATLAEIDRVLPAGGDIVIIGGTAAVPDSVRSTLVAKGYHVTRLAGVDRYETAVAVAETFDDPTACFALNGRAFPDALSASAPAAELGMPILLVRRDEIPAEVQAYLSANAGTLATGYIAGDGAVVATSVRTRLDRWIETVVRLAGYSRYDTSLAIAKHFYPTPDAVGLATGEDYPDGLTGSVLCAHRGGPLLLTRPSELPSGVAAYLTSGKPHELTVFGGGAAIEAEVRYDLEALW